MQRTAGRLAARLNEELRIMKPKTLALAIYTSICGHVLASVYIGDDRNCVGWMYHEASDSQSDSGWRFFSGEETQQFADDPANTKI